MAVDMFLKLDGIPGDSNDRQIKGEIVLESFSWGETNTLAHNAFTAGGGAGAGKVSFQDFHFTARVSKASPKLLLACASGQHIPTGTVTLRKGTAQQENQFVFLVYKFTNVIITSVQDTGSGDVPVELVSFAFQKVFVEFKEQSPTGALTAIDFAWDLLANRKA